MVDGKASYSEGRLGGTVNELNLEYSLATRLEKEALQLHSYLQVDMAHTVMLAEQGVLDGIQAGLILKSLREIESLEPGELPLDPRLGSLLLQVEAFMEERIGDDVAGRMHTGRSRNDQHEAANRIHMRDGLLQVVEATLRLQDEVLDLAGEHHDTLMPGYTHLQHAQPTTLGHYLMRHFYPFERNQQRLEGAFDRANLSSLGGAACSGTTWPLDRRRTAHLLGHGDIVMNSADAGVFTRDHPQESAAVLSILVNDIGRLAGTSTSGRHGSSAWSRSPTSWRTPAASCRRRRTRMRSSGYGDCRALPSAGCHRFSGRNVRPLLRIWNSCSRPTRPWK